MVTHVRGKTVHQMLVFIGLVCISFALVLGLSCIMLYQIFYLLGGTIGHTYQGCYIVTYLLFYIRYSIFKERSCLAIYLGCINNRLML